MGKLFTFWHLIDCDIFLERPENKSKMPLLSVFSRNSVLPTPSRELFHLEMRNIFLFQPQLLFAGLGMVLVTAYSNGYELNATGLFYFE